MGWESRIERISSAELPEKLERLEDGKITGLALIGPSVGLPASPDEWPDGLQDSIVYQLIDIPSRLPRELLRLERLRSLTLRALGRRDDDVVVFTERLGNLTSLNLTESDVGNLGVQSIARNLGQLTTLNLWGNSVDESGVHAIAKHLDRLASLTLFGSDVGDAGARTIVENLHHLKSLCLESCTISEIGARVIAEGVGQLTYLNLGGNNLGNAGTLAIAEHLSRLTSLSLWRCKVSDVGARAIAEHLAQLTELDLAENVISDAGVWAIARNLNKLKSLELSVNDFGDEAVAAIGQYLTDLVSVNLFYNERITSIAPLAHLPLSRLDVSSTGVEDLSPLKSRILAGLPVQYYNYTAEGAGIYVEECPLTHPPQEVASEGPEAVLNYFREIEAQGVDRLYEAKLLIVGEGGAGKTSLLRRMFMPEQDLPTEDETTRGIAIHRHEFPIADGRTFRLNTWDFGGQQIYHATHQFFLTKRSLYVLVDDTRSDNTSIHDEGFKFWLEVVETLSDSSPLLIFQNEKGGRSKSIDVAGIKGRFPNVQDPYRGNLEEVGAAEGLRQAVEYFAQQLPHIGEDVPAKWVPIREELETLARDRPHISLEEYFEVYGHHLELDRDKALHLSRYLHDLGVFLHFQQPPELRRTIFLQNQWVTEAVFRLLDDEQVKGRRGRFTLADCDRVWAEPGYAEKDVELRALMVSFELSYRLHDTDEEAWLVPQHLSPSRPEALNEWAAGGDLVLTYRYGFLPRGLVSRLMVRMNRFVQQPDQCWSSGALFEHGDTQVLVETAARGNEITLRARGPERQALLSVIASDLDALNDSFQGLKDRVGKWVPCICDTCVELKEPAMFSQQELIDRKQRGKPTIECPRPPLYADVGVLELLDGMDLEQWLGRAEHDLSENGGGTASQEEAESAESEGEGEVRTIRIFLASSAELREDRDAFDLYFRQQNDLLRKQGIYLEIHRWENALDAMSKTRLQDEYNRAIRECDLFVSLFMTKTGKYTEEEFDVARRTFEETGKPLIYTYFRQAKVSTSASNRDDLLSLWDFQKKLDDLGHFRTEYESIDGLKRHFRDQLDKLRAKGSL